MGGQLRKSGRFLPQAAEILSQPKQAAVTTKQLNSMKIVITGSLGHVGQPLAQTLVRQGHAVTVITSQADKQTAVAALGATAAIGSVQDLGFLAATFAGAGAVFAMIPPNFGAPDPRAYYQECTLRAHSMHITH